MTQQAWTRAGQPIDAADIPLSDWEALKAKAQMGDFLMPCCRAPAVLKTSINGLPFFSHLHDECNTAPETVWHRSGKAGVLAALSTLGIEGQEEVPGQSPSGGSWEADVLFSAQGRTIAIELLLKRDFGSKFPAEGIGTGLLPELPVAILNPDVPSSPVIFGGGKAATLHGWLGGVLDGSFRYRGGSWNLD